MRHARADYERFQDPAAHPDLHIHEFVGQLAEAVGRKASRDELAARVIAFFDGEPAAAERVEVARRFAERASLPSGSTPVSPDEPVFLIRGQDVCAVEAVECYARIAGAHGAHDVYLAARRWAQEIRRWQERTGKSKRPDLPGGGGA